MKTTANIFKSLADETRIRILLLLQGRPELCVCDLMQALGLPQSTVSRHLSYLKRGGWLMDRRGGTWMHYSINPKLDPFLQAQLALLISRLAGTEIATNDLKKLSSRLATKNNVSCS
jgi:ArsR family transcriptional regulator